MRSGRSAGSADRAWESAPRPAAPKARAERMPSGSVSFDDEGLQDEVPHLSLAADADTFVQILAQVLVAAATLDLLQRDGTQVGDDVLGHHPCNLLSIVAVHHHRALDADPHLFRGGE